MASLQDLKRQKQSIQNQSRVMKALQTVSAVKFRKAESRVKKARPYAENVEQMMRDVAGKATSTSPLLVGREVNRIALLSVTSDRGFCGAFNSQIVRRTMRFREEHERDAKLLQLSSGRKAANFFRFRHIGLVEEYSGFSDNPSYEQAQEIGRRLTRLFEEQEADEVWIVYNRFQSALVQQPILTRLLPIAPEVEEAGERSESGDVSGTFFEYVPGTEQLLGRLVPKYVETTIFQAFLESAAGEHGARMTAMKNATDNANELAQKLTTQINKARQAQITQEILEIAAGADALASN